MELLGSDELPCSLNEYWTLFQSNQSDFNYKVKMNEGCKDCSVSKWETDDV